MGTAASKLLYTLHWTLLDAAEECADADREAGIAPREPFPYIFPLTCIQVLSLFFYFLSSSVCLFYIFNGSQMATNFFISPFESFNLLSGAHLFYLFRSAFFFFAFSIRTEWGGTKKGIRLPFRSATSPVERSRFAKLPAGERTQDLAGPVGLPPSQRPVLYGARPTQKEQHHS